jgi:A/G-specific adenine glycosylase
LHCAAIKILSTYQGVVPKQLADLIELPGVGLSTAGAIRSLGYNLPAAILDGNVKRVLCRYHAVEGWPGHQETLKKLWALAESHTPKTRPRHYTQAMMDLGAIICTRKKPHCHECPLQTRCQAFKTGQQTHFPATKAKTPLPIKKTRFLCLINAKQEVLLERGLHGRGLWTFLKPPLTIAHTNLPQTLATRCNTPS